jgi:hypothetical protein
MQLHLRVLLRHVRLDDLDPLVLVGGRQRARDDAELGIFAGCLGDRVDQRGADALEGGLVDEPLICFSILASVVTLTFPSSLAASCMPLAVAAK